MPKANITITCIHFHSYIKSSEVLTTLLNFQNKEPAP